jgi:hypothetical protein
LWIRRDEIKTSQSSKGKAHQEYSTIERLSLYWTEELEYNELSPKAFDAFNTSTRNYWARKTAKKY